MEELKYRAQYNQAINANGVAVFEGVADWCGRCKEMAPFVDEVGRLLSQLKD